MPFSADCKSIYEIIEILRKKVEESKTVKKKNWNRVKDFGGLFQHTQILKANYNK